MGILGQYIQFLSRSAEFEIEKKVLSFLPRGESLVYLDLGCDDGAKSLERSQKIGTNNILGVEVVSSRAKEAESKNIKVIKVDLNNKWTFADNSIDCITATEVIEHLSDLDNFFSESKRILKKGGRLIISTENLAGYHNILALLLGNQPYTGPYLSTVYPIGHRPCGKYYHQSNSSVTINPHLNVMTIKALEQLLQRYGFYVRGSWGVAFYPLPSPLSNLLSYIDKYHASYCVVCGER
ncbi:MAG: hypothetical protein UU73_C0001G0140 [Candidatus Daviesbacteria bacterium GW2011_GWA1_41_61]|uniref:Methyltransferase type 11 domain-containing protein n=1 Tax=Candidatus Daviesbacteria bacterium GW2011_GWA2_40_9 TaxID=1618424 RepID=A0A0G0U1P2_9BACT|nr:MAG: hypothetical protein UU26_C0001G0025 [Candidatus Daviesbacteria bacterium GW2011_GWC1_40_9]KKR83034.1 MAG: hypothetical protein UU29_C0008G0143 [Candidatus Daviesbacteria bacterium GW2011_GWA2_40_9]KKR92959.1 MAG: hypothetical protein UU44_C0004G0141 [Candidatus Daviesbacteria bacterium GW2011_GWB1_41_15]KKS15503.1 MAG: hypothetical protein UU73_C0001G0140 [Candidatus Daviesbacteria bacterium GW2011_GWA1_41_61]